MPASQAARPDVSLPPPRLVAATAVPSESFVAERPGAFAALSWAVCASTLHRLRRGECALLAINLSLILHHGDGVTAHGLMQAVVSVLAILVMYAFNDLVDAPVDYNNPKKDRALIAAWMEHRRAGVLATLLLKGLTLGLALATLGSGAAIAVAAVMVVNVVYSTMLKGVPVADIAAVWIWGSLYAAIVEPAPALVFLVGLMTGICHLFQALDDRAPDAANGIQTTAVRSAVLSRNVLVGLTLVLFGSIGGLLGLGAAVTAIVPLVLFFEIDDAGLGWLFTKGYFAVLWLAILGTTSAAG